MGGYVESCHLGARSNDIGPITIFSALLGQVNSGLQNRDAWVLQISVP